MAEQYSPSGSSYLDVVSEVANTPSAGGVHLCPNESHVHIGASCILCHNIIPTLNYIFEQADLSL